MKNAMLTVLLGAVIFLSQVASEKPAQAGWFDSIVESTFGRCGIPGEGTARAVNALSASVYVVIEKDGKLSGREEAELAPGATLTTGICNRDGIRVKVYTVPACGKTFISESRYSRVYNEETVRLGPGGFRFLIGDFLDIGSRVGGFALTYIAGGYGIPPALLAAMGVNEAEIVAACQNGGPVSCAAAVYKKLPEDLFATIRADTCLAAKFGLSK